MIPCNELERRFPRLDPASLHAVKRFIGKTQFVPTRDGLTQHPLDWHYLWAGLCSEEEFKRGQEAQQECSILCREFHLPDGVGAVCSLVYHHGLRTISIQHKQYLEHKIFIDAGACAGDSTLVFLDYSPAKIIAFEPSPSNCKAFRETMAQNSVSSEKVVLVNKGLSDHEGTTRFSDSASGACSLAGEGADRADLMPLDFYAYKPVGLIKADLEGMGLEMLRGAVETIRRDRPILSISIYHNTNELFGIYEFLNDLDLDYEFRIEFLDLPWHNYDLTLLALPKLS